VVGENGAHPANGFEEGYPKTIVNQVWKSQIAISREMRDDNKIGEMTKRATKLTDSFYRTRERFFANLFGTASRGETSVTVNGFDFDCGSADGLCLFSKAHPAKVSGGDQCNMFETAFSEEALGAAMTIMLLGLVAFQLLPDVLLGFFNPSDTFLELGRSALRIVSIHFPIAAVGISLGASFQALGNGIYSTITSLCRQLIALLPVAFLLSLTGNVHVVWWAFPIAEVVSATVTLILFARIYKKKIKPLMETV